jgi:hypothetical protein
VLANPRKADCCAVVAHRRKSSALLCINRATHRPSSTVNDERRNGLASRQYDEWYSDAAMRVAHQTSRKKCPCPIRPSECTNRRRIRTRRRCIETHPPPVIVGNKTPRNVPQSTSERHLIAHSQPMVQAGAPRCQSCPAMLSRPRAPHMTCEKLDRSASHRGRSPVKNIRGRAPPATNRWASSTANSHILRNVSAA